MHSPKQKRSYNLLVTKVLFFITIIILLFAGLYIYSQLVYKRQVNEITDVINIKKESLKIIEKELVKDPFIQRLLIEKRYQDLLFYSKNLMVGKKLSYFSITDLEGNIILRAHDQAALGDRILFKEKSNTELYGLDKDQLPFLARGIKITNNNNVIGYLNFGYKFNDDLAKEIGKKLRTSTVFYANNKQVGSFDIYDKKDRFPNQASFNCQKNCWKKYKIQSGALSDQNYGFYTKVNFPNENSKIITMIAFNPDGGYPILIAMIVMLGMLWFLFFPKRSNFKKDAFVVTIFLSLGLSIYCLYINFFPIDKLTLQKFTKTDYPLRVHLDSHYYKQGQLINLKLYSSNHIGGKFNLNIKSNNKLEIVDIDTRLTLCNILSQNDKSAQLSCDISNVKNKNILISRLKLSAKSNGIGSVFIEAESGNKKVFINKAFNDGENVLIY